MKNLNKLKNISRSYSKAIRNIKKVWFIYSIMGFVIFGLGTVLLMFNFKLNFWFFTLLLLHTVLSYHIIYVAIAFMHIKPKRIKDNYFPFNAKKVNKNIKFSIIVALKNESPDIVEDTLKNATQQSYWNYDIYLVNDESNSYNTIAYKELATKYNVNYIDNKYPNGKQFGAQLTAAELSDADYIALIDVDYVINKDWLDLLSRYINKYRFKIFSSPQIYRNLNAPTAVLADSMLFFEFQIENMYRLSNCANTSSGTVVSIERNLFNSLYASKCKNFNYSPYYTEDFGFAIKAIYEGITIFQTKTPYGFGLGPPDPKELARQHIKWLDDFPQIIEWLIIKNNRLSVSSHLIFHSTKQARPLIFLIYLVLAFFVSFKLSIFFVLSNIIFYFSIYYLRRTLKIRYFPIYLKYIVFSSYFLINRIASKYFNTKFSNKQTKKN